MKEAKDPFQLQRFLDGQAPVYGTVLTELQAGHKQSHWMWFIFPQIDGLGSRPWTVFYSIKSLAEAEAYLQHPILGRRLIECTQAVMQIEGKRLLEIFGKPDNRKFCSSMTLFLQAAQRVPKLHAAQALFEQALQGYCDGQDTKTLALLR